MTELQGYTIQFETEFNNAVKTIVPLVQDITQEEKARLFGVSRRTIINFEKGKARNYWLLFCYRMKVNGDAIV